MRRRTLTLTSMGVVFLSVGLVLHTGLGTVWIPPARVIAALTGVGGNPVDLLIVRELRLPRGLLAATVGAMLGLAGAILQAVTRNRLADPSLTGVSAGGVLLAVLFLTKSFGLPDIGRALPSVVLVGCLLGGGCVYVLAQVRTSFDPSRLVLTAVVINAMAGSLTAILLIRDDRALGGILPWLIGSLNGRVWEDMWLVLPWALFGIPSGLLTARIVNVVQLDDTLASSVGANVGRCRALLFGVAALLVAGAVSVVGGLGFVGLIAPNALRNVIGEDGRRLLPLSALYGAIIVVFADTVAQALTLKPPFPSSVQRAGLPVGAVLAIAGTVFVLVTLRPNSTRKSSVR